MKRKKSKGLLPTPKQLNAYRDRSNSFYDSTEWRQLRKKFIKLFRRKGCSYCGKPFTNKEFVQVDHMVPISQDWSRRLDPTNLRIMHRWCHNSYTHTKKTPIRVDGFPADGSWG